MGSRAEPGTYIWLHDCWIAGLSGDDSRWNGGRHDDTRRDVSRPTLAGVQGRDVGNMSFVHGGSTEVLACVATGAAIRRDLPGVLANNSGCVLASGSIGITLMFAIESTDKASIIQQMTETGHMLMNRDVKGCPVHMCKGTLAAVLCCIEQDKPPRNKLLMKTLSDVAAMACIPTVKRAHFGQVAVEPYLPDDPSFCIFEVSFSCEVATKLFFTGALIPFNTRANSTSVSTACS